MSKRASIAWLVCLAAAPAVWAQPFGFSVSDANKHLYRIDLADGTAVDQGILNYPDGDELEGLFSVGGNLAAIGEANYGPGGLYLIQNPPGRMLVANRRLGTEAGAARNPQNGRVYNLQADDLLPPNTARTFLYTFNPANPTSATLLGFDSDYADGLAFDGAGRAYATDFRIACSLYRVNLMNGLLTAIGSLGLDPADCTGFDSGAAWDFDSGTLYAIREDGVIYTIDETTGQATFVALVEEDGVQVPGDLEGLEIP